MQRLKTKITLCYFYTFYHSGILLFLFVVGGSIVSCILFQIFDIQQHSLSQLFLHLFGSVGYSGYHVWLHLGSIANRHIAVAKVLESVLHHIFGQILLAQDALCGILRCGKGADVGKC